MTNNNTFIYTTDYNCPYFITKDNLETGQEIVLKDSMGETDWNPTDVKCDAFYAEVIGVREVRENGRIAYHYRVDWSRPVYDTPTTTEIRERTL